MIKLKHSKLIAVILAILFTVLATVPASAIEFDEDSYMGMTGQLIPGWYYHYSSSEDVYSGDGVNVNVHFNYPVHFFYFSYGVSAEMTDVMNPNSVYAHFYYCYSVWWESIGSSPMDPYSRIDSADKSGIISLYPGQSTGGISGYPQNKQGGAMCKGCFDVTVRLNDANGSVIHDDFYIGRHISW